MVIGLVRSRSLFSSIIGAEILVAKILSELKNLNIKDNDFRKK